MAVPLKTPPAIVNKLNAGITQALASPDVNRRMADLGLEIVGGSAQVGHEPRAHPLHRRHIVVVD
ncbi:MAG: tripartite tricarboxylate transporter substrate-binding protein [Ilumatobacteraceae bacterium]